ncbi:MAG: mechanosensitive ion channel domain-containing protein [Planctomycetaceae bacterium]
MRPSKLFYFCFVALALATAQAEETKVVEPPNSAAPNAETSDAERIADLRQTLDAEQARLKELEAELNDPASEYAKAEKEFQAFDRELEQKSELLEKFKADGKSAEALVLEKELTSIEKQRKLAKELFELALEERKTLREEVATLRRKTQLDQEALDELTGAKPKPEETPKPSDKEEDREMPSADSKNSDPDAEKKSEPDDESPNKSESEEKSDDADPELMQAQEEAKKKAEEAEEAQEETRSIAARIADLQKLIVQQQKILALARKKAELALATQKELEAEWTKREIEGAPATELQELRAGAAEARQRFAAAQRDVTDATDRLNDRRSELGSLQSEQILVLQEAEQTRLAAKSANEAVEELRNPFTFRNISQWLLDHGPRVLLIVLCMFVMNYLSQFFSKRTINLVAGGTSRGSPIERENRARTLVGVFQNFCTVAIFIVGILMVLEECGANITVLMGGVAVIGLAVAFGAQNLIKDYFSGFVMLLENQYMLNDTIRIGAVAGQVERITLRMTVLRDICGVVHFIPNGTIDSVSNETNGWSRAIIEVGVAYHENVDQAMGVLTDLARELRGDTTFGPMIVEDAQPPAVDALADSAVTLRFTLKTKPNQQHAVRRELLRRIKNRFDELGIELPFPHRTLIHRYESESALPLGVNGVRKSA